MICRKKEANDRTVFVYVGVIFNIFLNAAFAPLLDRRHSVHREMCVICNLSVPSCFHQVWRPNHRGSTSCSPPATTSIYPPALLRGDSCRGQTTGGPSWTAKGSEALLSPTCPGHCRDTIAVPVGAQARRSGCVLPEFLSEKVPWCFTNLLHSVERGFSFVWPQGGNIRPSTKLCTITTFTETRSHLTWIHRKCKRAVYCDLWTFLCTVKHISVCLWRTHSVIPQKVFCSLMETVYWCFLKNVIYASWLRHWWERNTAHRLMHVAKRVTGIDYSGWVVWKFRLVEWFVPLDFV